MVRINGKMPNFPYSVGVASCHDLITMTGYWKHANKILSYFGNSMKQQSSRFVSFLKKTLKQFQVQLKLSVEEIISYWLCSNIWSNVVWLYYSYAELHCNVDVLVSLTELFHLSLKYILCKQEP